MCERIEDLVAEVRAFVRALDSDVLSSARAVELVELMSELDKLAIGARTLAAARVCETRAWFGSSQPNMTAWMAARMGSTLRAASSVIETASSIGDLPATREALVSGRLSEVQAAEIAAAACADPAAEETLLQLASQQSVGALKEKCRDVIAAAVGDEDANERIHAGRYLRHWTDRDGAVRLDMRLAPDAGAPLIAVIDARTNALIEEARRCGRREPGESHAADALCSLVDGAGAPRATVHVFVSQTALDRGHTVAGETCRIQGVGPISVSAAKRMAVAGSVTILESNGVDVTRVSNVGRLMPASLRQALEARDPTCVVPGCNRRHGLEIDHVVPLSEGGKTELGNLARLCRWHHGQKTHHGWQISGEPGRWTWDPAQKSRGP